MKIVFMGTPDFARDSLKAIYDSGYEISAVVTNPDKKQGRGMKLSVSPVKEYACLKDLRVMQPEKVRKNQEFIQELKEINPDVICVVAYGKILPKEILEIPKHGCINVHGSLLPKYRGAAPIQWAVINGDKTTGVTTMYMDEGMDTGDMILSKEVEIGKDETTGELWQRLSKLGGELLVQTIMEIEKGSAKRIKQPQEYSHAPMLSKEMAKINWETMEAAQIKNLARGLDPIMGVYTFLDGKKIKFWKLECIESDDEVKTLENGEVILACAKQGLQIKTKNGALNVIEVQGENAKRMNISDFLRGNNISKKDKFK